ncbi:aspartate aminotransferase family protein [Emcibacter sp. SYSU 3D8]|uniref:aspartate aminotransferase family protein n=1 Tax=Emcibacter sp. SYSU 3D8 TaxID=3133969 RepID=UPI0031FEF217
MITAVMPTYARADLAFDKGKGSYLYSTEGEKFLDFCGGIAVTSLGHAHPHLVEALKAQAEALWHTSNLYRIPQQEKLAARLTEATFADTVFVCNSGAEALECAIKTTRKYHYVNGAPERFRIVTMEGAFHGRTLATIAAGGQAKHLEGFGPKVEGFDQVPFGDLDALSNAIGPATAGVLFEPVRGEGGINAIPVELMARIRKLCDERGILMVLDEVQCGIGRTGKLFAYQWSDIAPDILASAKGLGGGFPIGACLASEEAAKGMVAGSHGSTFGGNPMACAVANAVLDVVLAPGFLDRVQDLGGYMGQKLASVVAKHPDILDSVQGVGLIRGLRCKVPNTDLVNALRDQHVLTVGAGENQVRLLPPLTVTEDEIDEAVAAIDTACGAVAARLSPVP